MGLGLLGGRRLERRLLGGRLLGDVSWADVSWADVSWADVSWADTSYEDAAEGDTTGDPSGYELTPEQAAEIMADPETAPDPRALPPEIAAAVADDHAAAGATDGTDRSGRSDRSRLGDGRGTRGGEGREQSRPSLVRGIFGAYRKRGM